MERANLKGLMRPGGNLRPPEGDIYTPILDAGLVWKEIDWLRSFARAPVLLKGVLNPEDADRAVIAGYRPLGALAEAALSPASVQRLLGACRKLMSFEEKPNICAFKAISD
jgi:hypothetical protein